MTKRKLLPLVYALSLLLPLSYANAGVILSAHKYAWSNTIGYINFANVLVDDSSLSGYAWSANKGFIKFNPAQGGVFNDGTGNLSGFAWGEQTGWIDFDGVSIDGNGKFSGIASGVLSGSITFDCPTYCDVQTDWRPPATASTQSSVAPVGGGGIIPGFGVFQLPTLNTGAVQPPAITVPKINVPVAPTPISETQNNFPTTPKPSVNASSSVGIIVPASLLNGASEPPPLFDMVSDPVQLRVAPGELLPISVKLSNFGGGKRVDVIITYSVISSTGADLYVASETVAVETTANFIKMVQIPLGTSPGVYTAKTSIVYAGQVAPAMAEFFFTVERRILGLFQGDFLLYGGITLLLSIAALFIGRQLIVRLRKVRFTPFDYSHIPHDKRIFFEVLSDTVMAMRERVGDQALFIASHIEGLNIDGETGQVREFTDDPAKVIAALVSEYEKLLGKKVSFSLRTKK